MKKASLLRVISRIFTPLASLLDEVVKTGAARDLARAKLARLEAEAVAVALDFEEQRLATAARLVAAEAGGQSWLQRNWRPLTMLAFLVLVSPIHLACWRFVCRPRHGSYCRSGLATMLLAGRSKKLCRGLARFPDRVRWASMARRFKKIVSSWPALADRTLRRHEGRAHHPYQDTAGKLTIGIGRNLTDRGLNDDEIEYLFATDLRLAVTICRDLYPAFRGFHPARQAVLISMAFNLGKPRLAGFRRMRAAINRGDWGNAAAEAEASLWARQTRRRADEIARLLRAPDTA